MNLSKTTAQTTRAVGSTAYVYLAAIVAATSGLLFGFDIAVINGAILFLRSELHLDDVQTEFAVSVIAKTGMMSDSLSTTLLLLGPAKGRVLIQGMAAVSAVWIAPDARVETVMSGPQILFGRKA